MSKKKGESSLCCRQPRSNGVGGGRREGQDRPIRLLFVGINLSGSGRYHWLTRQSKQCAEKNPHGMTSLIRGPEAWEWCRDRQTRLAGSLLPLPSFLFLIVLQASFYLQPYNHPVWIGSDRYRDLRTKDLGSIYHVIQFHESDGRLG